MRERETLTALTRLHGAQILEKIAARRRALDATARTRVRAEVVSKAEGALTNAILDWRRAFQSDRMDPLLLTTRRDAISEAQKDVARASDRLMTAEREEKMHLELAARADARVALNDRSRKRLKQRLAQRMDDKAAQNFIELQSRGQPCR